MRRRQLLALLLSSPLCIYAENTHDCIYLQISLLNQSNQTCALTHSNLIHGKLSDDSRIPQHLEPMKKQQFFIRQTHFGPDIILNYQCGDANFKIETQQNICLFSAGSIHTSIIESHALLLCRSTKKGSSWGGQAGQVNWLIIPPS